MNIDLSVKESSAATRLLTPVDTFLKYHINAPGIETRDTAGNATLPAGYANIVIFNPLLTKNTLIYITPTTPTENRTLFVHSKESCEAIGNIALPDCQPHFTIGVDVALINDVSFNWWMIN